MDWRDTKARLLRRTGRVAIYSYGLTDLKFLLFQTPEVDAWISELVDPNYILSVVLLEMIRLVWLCYLPCNHEEIRPVFLKAVLLWMVVAPPSNFIPIYFLPDVFSRLLQIECSRIRYEWDLDALPLLIEKAVPYSD
jgi:hypothetical protein